MKTTNWILIVLIAMFLFSCSETSKSTTEPTPNDATVFIDVPVGNIFFMGSNLETNEQPQHIVMLTVPFSMSKYEVTQKEFSETMGYTPRNDYGAGDNFPVYYVNWYDCIKYCNLKSIANDLTPCYTIKDSTDPADWGSVPNYADTTGVFAWNNVICNFDMNGYRLPTEAEWEYTAGYDENSKYAWGNEEPDSTRCNYFYDYENYVANWHHTENVGSYQNGNSKLEICDLNGNIREWVWDEYSEYTEEYQTNPLGGSHINNFRVLRGGAYMNTYDDITNSTRSNTNPSFNIHNTGFRVVKTITN